MNSSLLAVLGSLVWAGGLGLGLQMSTNVDEAVRSQVDEQLALRASPAVVAPPPRTNPLPEPEPEKLYWEEVRQEAKRLGLRNPGPKRFKGAQSYRRWISKTRKLRLGRKLKKGPLLLSASLEKVRFMRQGAFVKSRHTVLTVRNRSSRPVAYRVDASAFDRGRCKVKGTRQHNAIALMPKQSAEITVCAGKSSIALRNLETLEISALGYHYLSRIPPSALGVDKNRAAAHVPPRGSRVCSQLEKGQLAKALRDRSLRWADIADFYSRHDCSKYEIPKNYRRARRRLKRLPVLASNKR